MSYIQTHRRKNFSGGYSFLGGEPEASIAKKESLTNRSKELYNIIGSSSWNGDQVFNQVIQLKREVEGYRPWTDSDKWWPGPYYDAYLEITERLREINTAARAKRATQGSKQGHLGPDLAKAVLEEERRTHAQREADRQSTQQEATSTYEKHKKTYEEGKKDLDDAYSLFKKVSEFYKKYKLPLIIGGSVVVVGVGVLVFRGFRT